MSDFEAKQSIRMVLHNPELLEMILHHLSGSKQTLVSASLTTKAFSEPAFNVLWYEMSSIWPLFRILPVFKRKWNGKYVFTGPIRNEHLQRVLYYAKRIRFLDYKDADNDPYTNASRDLMISTFMRMDKLGAFFPLRKIHIHGPIQCNTMLLPLTSPNLDNIVIRTKMVLPALTEIGLVSFLQSVAQCPLLRTFAIEGTFNDTLQVLPDFINLHRLTMRLENTDIPLHFLKRFASSMPSLLHLHIHIANCRLASPNDGPQGRRSIFQLSFPSLETLYVGCNSIHLEDLLGFLNVPLLKSASFVIIQSDANDPFMQQFFELNRQLLKDKVDRLVIRTMKPSLSYVKSFEDLRNLVVLSLHGAISMSDIVDTFDGSWTRSLVRLQLMQMHPTNPLNCMSIAALWFIADACPNLELLEISIHRPDELVVKQDEQERKPHNLKKLVFLNLPGVWGDTTTLAIEFVSFLDQLFPSMAVPKYIGATSDKPGARVIRRAWWKSVEDMWRMCQTIKKRKMSSNVDDGLSTLEVCGYKFNTTTTTTIS